MKQKPLWISLLILSIFAILMVFGLKHNPNHLSSQLIGKKIPSFTALLSNEKKFDSPNSLSDKNWTVLNFWATSCYVCRNEASELQKFYTSYPDFVSINIEEDLPAIKQWQSDFQQTFPVVLDSTGAISILFGVTGTPETFFIDQNHIVRYRIAGEVDQKLLLHLVSWLSQNPLASEEQIASEISTWTGGQTL